MVQFIDPVDEIMARFDLSTVRINGEAKSISKKNFNKMLDIFSKQEYIYITSGNYRWRNVR